MYTSYYQIFPQPLPTLLNSFWIRDSRHRRSAILQGQNKQMQEVIRDLNINQRVNRLCLNSFTLKSTRNYTKKHNLIMVTTYIYQEIIVRSIRVWTF